MPTTTNFALPYPQSSDSVDIPRDIGALAAAIDPRLVPSGLIAPFAGETAPAGWLMCDGTAVSRTGYSTLYAVIGTRYGAGDGSTTFNLPNLKGRVPVGFDLGQTEFDTLGETGGSKSGVSAHGHTLSLSITSAGSHGHTGGADGVGDHGHNVSDTTELEIHTHYMDGRQTTSTSHTHQGTSTVAAGITGGAPAVTLSTGVAPNELAPDVVAGGAHGHSLTINAAGDHAHGASGSADSTGTAAGNLQPYLVVNYIVKA